MAEQKLPRNVDASKQDGVTQKYTISYSNVKGGQNSIGFNPPGVYDWGDDMMDSDPLFVDWENDDIHLTYPSPCRNEGANHLVNASVDFEEDPRISYTFVDMGADEFHPHLYYTGTPELGNNIDLKFIGHCGDTVRLWMGSGVPETPLHHPVYGDWYLKTPLLLGLTLGAVPPPDGFFVLPVHIPAGYTPWDIPLQTGIGIQLTNLYYEAPISSQGEKKILYSFSLKHLRSRLRKR